MTTVYCILTIPEPLFVGQTCSDNKIQFNCEDLQTEGIKIKPIKDDIFNKEQVAFLFEEYSRYMTNETHSENENMGFIDWLKSKHFIQVEFLKNNIKPIE